MGTTALDEQLATTFKAKIETNATAMKILNERIKAVKLFNDKSDSFAENLATIEKMVIVQSGIEIEPDKIEEQLLYQKNAESRLQEMTADLYEVLSFGETAVSLTDGKDAEFVLLKMDKFESDYNNIKRHNKEQLTLIHKSLSVSKEFKNNHEEFYAWFKNFEPKLASKDFDSNKGDLHIQGLLYDVSSKGMPILESLKKNAYFLKSNAKGINLIKIDNIVTNCNKNMTNAQTEVEKKAKKLNLLSSSLISEPVTSSKQSTDQNLPSDDLITIGHTESLSDDTKLKILSKQITDFEAVQTQKSRTEEINLKSEIYTTMAIDEQYITKSTGELATKFKHKIETDATSMEYAKKVDVSASSTPKMKTSITLDIDSDMILNTTSEEEDIAIEKIYIQKYPSTIQPSQYSIEVEE